MINVRKAVVEDAAAIANVHIHSWRETYTGIVPDQVIAELPLQFKRRHELWQLLPAEASQDTLVAEHSDYGVVGMINGGAARDTGFAGHCEVYCLYLLGAFHGQGVGYGLLREFFAKSRARGYTASYAWVLEGNPTIAFYERSGAAPTGDVKTDDMGGTEVNELCFAWRSID